MAAFILEAILCTFWKISISTKEKNFADIFQAYLSIKPIVKDIYFCHPGYVDQKLRNRDSVIESREETLNFLKSDQCQEIMEHSKISLNTFDGISIY